MRTKDSAFVADIGIFEKLNWIAETTGISQTDWASAAWPNAKRNQQPRIAELKQIFGLMKSQGISQEEASDRIGRLCTFPKMIALQRGLVKMLGAKVVAKRIEEWEKFAKRKRRATYSEREREVMFFFMWVLLKDKDKDKILTQMRKIIDSDAELNK